MEVKGPSLSIQADFTSTKSTKRTPAIHGKSPVADKVGEKFQEINERQNSKDILIKQVTNMNELFETSRTSIKFSIHEDLGRTYVQVVNQVDQEVIKEIPSEEFLDMIASMLKFAGLIVDERI
ncbi:flagellar protein FlaG [Bacillus sp. JCM 19034]|uniref:flagellar protein FlaG n=1 Tax=Bacillus sp. JCM 19034 TaxID=1481928 RepID=UPI00078660E9|nr:flagellar protein FlaG [Bacillus sp. JCM 19034]